MNVRILKKVAFLLLIYSSFFMYGQNTQSRLFPSYGKYIDFNSNNVNNLPIYGSNNGPEFEYFGQSPLYAQTIVYDEKCSNNILFFIVDENIYNKYGKAFDRIYNEDPYVQDTFDYTSFIMMSEQETFPNDVSFLNLISNHYNGQIDPALIKRDIYSTHYGEVGITDMEIIPIPKSCNEYYLVYSVNVRNIGDSNDQNRFSIYPFYRKITYLNDEEIILGQPISFEPLLENGNIDEDNPNFSMAVSKYRKEDDSYYLFMNYGSKLYTYKIDENGFEKWSQDNITPYPFKVQSINNLTQDNPYNGFFNGEMEVKEVTENNGTKYYYLAHPNISLVSSLLTTQISLYKIDYNSSDIITQHNFDLPNQNTSKGLEFSDNGKYLYFTYSGQNNALNYISTDFLETGGNAPASFEHVNTNLNASDYQNSQIELGMDGKLYIPNPITGHLSSFSSPNSPLNGTLTENTYPSIDNFELRVDVGNDNNHIFLTSQIDGEDYTERFHTNENICCEKFFKYDIDLNPDYTNANSITVDNNMFINDNNDYNPNYGLVTINSNQGNITWTPQNNPFTCNGTSDIYLKNDLIINEGSQLTLKDLTLHFTEGHGVKILKGSANTTANKGAILNLDHAVLTADDHCNITNVMWKGVELVGDNSSQTIANTIQPKIKMYNSSMIEYASKAVDIQKGGIIDANTCLFKDNKHGVVFLSYNNQISKIVKCTFKTTNDLYNLKDQIQLDFVSINETQNVRLIGNKFENVADKPIVDAKQIFWGNGSVYIIGNRGVYATGSNSSLILDKTPDILHFERKNKFINLNYGVLAVNSSSVSIKNSEFTECYKGVRLMGIADAGITMIANNFDVADARHPSAINNEVYGASIESSTGYVVQNNKFHDGIAGLYVINSGEAYNEIRHNKYYELQNNGNETGVIAKDINAEYDPNCPECGEGQGECGLEIYCNHFSDNANNIAVIDGLIQHKQYNGTNSNIPSNNWFNKHQEPNYQGFDYYIENSPINYIYYQPKENSLPEYLLDWDDPNTIGDAGDYYTHDYNEIIPSKINVVLNNPWEMVCKDEFPTNGDGIDPFDPIIAHDISKVDNAKFNADSKKDELDAKIDGGNTQALQAEVDNLTQYNYFQTCIDLINVGPYLSDGVITSFMDNQIYRPVAKTIVLMANSPLPVVAKQKIDDVNIPPFFKWYLKQLQNGVYQREQDEMEINALYADADKTTNKMIAFALSNDTVPEKLDSIITWLEDKETIESYYRLVPLYIKKAEYNNAATTLEALLAEANTIGGKVQENAENYKTLQQINYQIMQHPDSADFIISTNIKQLEPIAEGEGKQAGIARYMLYNYDKKQFANYKQTYPLPDVKKSLALQPNKPSQTYTGEKPDAMISVYPNPTDGQLNVEYINIENNSNINIYDMQGKIIMSFKAQQNFGMQSIDVSGLNSGNYLIGFGKNQTVKFIVK